MIMNNTKFNIYNCPNSGRTNKLGNIKEKFIYIFGGIMSFDGYINKNLYLN